MGILAPIADQQQPPQFTDNPDENYATRVRDFIDRKTPYDHIHHIRKFRRFRKSDLFYEGKQWLRASYNTDPTRTPHWSEREYDPNNVDQIPMPVYNEVMAHIQNESARLGRPEYKPYVRPSGKAPDASIKEACRKAIEILDAAKEEMGWDEVTETLYHHMPMYGGGWLKSWWDVSMDKTVRIPVDTAMKCPADGCDFKVASPELTPEQAGEADAQKADQPTRLLAQDTIDPKMGRTTKYSIDSCLQCDTHKTTQPQTDEMGQPMYDPSGAMILGDVDAPGPPKLQPFTPVNDELKQADQFGRSFGKDVPLGEWKVRNASSYDVFPENLGMDCSGQTWREIGEVHIESLDWIRSRFPDKADQVKAESPQALLKWHPIVGERALFSGTATGMNVFRNHCRVKEFHKKPYIEKNEAGKWAMNKGRSIMMAGNVLLLDGPFMIESDINPGTYVERVHYDYAPWELRSGGRELDGVGLMEQLFDAQENHNEGKSQTQDTRKRMASPKFRATRGMNLDYETSGAAGDMWLWDPDPMAPGEHPEEIGSTTISPGVAAEMGADLEYMDRVSGKTAVEDGNVPPGVSAAAAIQMLAEHTAERRRPRIRRIRKMYMRTWRHGLELMHEFAKKEDNRTYSVKGDADEWTERAWSGADIAGQFDVRIDAEPDHDTEVQRQERTRDAILNLKIVNPADPAIAMEVAHELDLAPELFENQNLQDDRAEREFIDFLVLGIEPVIDTDLDSDQQHYDRHGRDCHSEKWRALEREANWSQALSFLWGWDQAQPQAAPPPQSGMPAMAPPPPMSPFDLFEQTIAPTMNLPPLPELHIAACWVWLLGTKGVQATPQLKQVIRFRAHVSAHKRNEQGQQQAAQAGAPVVAAPEAPATAAGTIPTAGALDASMVPQGMAA